MSRTSYIAGSRSGSTRMRSLTVLSASARLDTCRDFEDTRRRDQDEGKALLHTPIIPEHCEGLNKVCLLCCSVDLDRRLKLL
jgi:hypothetical protein